jgi:hypothetical protein
MFLGRSSDANFSPIIFRKATAAGMSSNAFSGTWQIWLVPW